MVTSMPPSKIVRVHPLQLCGWNRFNLQSLIVNRRWPG